MFEVHQRGRNDKMVINKNIHIPFVCGGNVLLQ